MELTDFLGQRLDEDETTARAALYVPGTADFSWSDVEYNSVVAETHGMRWTPEHVLADVAAKRAIVAAHPMEYLDAWGVSVCTTCSSDLNPTWAEGGGPCDTLRLFAQPYTEHPDYDPAWRTA